MSVKLPDHMPTSMAGLPTNKVGYPVPWFVAWIDDEPDFRVIRSNGIQEALGRHICWVCGQPRVGGLDAFVIGPMCAVNRVSAEPPSHLLCARWSAIACPFLANETMVRRLTGLPEQRVVAGEMIERNPGVALVWKTRSADWQPFSAGPGHILFDVGDPRGVEWYAHGREATREEVLKSIDSGLPILEEACEKEATPADQVAARAQLKRQHAAALELVPA